MCAKHLRQSRPVTLRLTPLLPQAYAPGRSVNEKPGRASQAPAGSVRCIPGKGECRTGYRAPFYPCPTGKGKNMELISVTGMVCMVCTVAIVYARSFRAKVSSDGVEFETSPAKPTPKARAAER